MYKHLIISVLLTGTAALVPHTAVAGPFGDDMAKCFVNSTSDVDRADLVRWVYSAMSLNPDLASMARLSDQQRSELTAKAGQLVSRLIFQSCRSQFVAAVRNEGPQTITYAFQVLGQVAMRGLLADPHVTEGMQALGKSIDQSKLKELVADGDKQ